MVCGRQIALGMSGGVDSSVSVALLLRAGYEVIGVTCRFQDNASADQAIADAAATCKRFGITHVVKTCEDAFDRYVVQPFVHDYAHGYTPSPCVGCNARMKIPTLMKVADSLGCDHIATGHYARVATLEEDILPGKTKSTSSSTRYVVLSALDARKDQSYMLALLTQEQLARLVLPLGAMTKAEVRVMAADLGLEVAEKPESQDVCFIEGDYRPFLQEHGVTSTSGHIVDRSGRILGTHKGLFNFTVGQRKGIGVPGPEPYYVVEKRICDQALVVGTADEARITGVVVRDTNWQALATISQPCEAMVKLRYRSAPAACIIEPNDGGRIFVKLRNPQPTTAAGQYAVFYMGATVLGGGMIEEVLA